MKKYKFQNNVQSKFDLFVEPSEKNVEKHKFIPKIRTNFLMMNGDSRVVAPIENLSSETTSLKIEELIYLNYSQDDLDYSFLPALRILLGNIFAIESKDWEIKYHLIPKTTNYNIKQFVTSFYDGTIEEIPYELSREQFWLYITHKNLETQKETRYYIDYTFNNRAWYTFKILITNETINFYINGGLIDNLIELESETILEKLNCIGILQKPFDAYFGWNMNIAIKEISIAQNDAYINEPYDYFEDHLYTSFYSTLVCDQNCPKAMRTEVHDVVAEEYIWKPCLVLTEDSVDGQEVCDFVSSEGQPICPLTRYIKNDLTYPKKYDMEDGMILSPHYKIEISLTEHPLGSTYIINKGLAESIYDSFEESRPAARVSHYVEKIEFLTDFSGKTSALYQEAYGANWSIRCTTPSEIVEGGEIISYGGDGMEDKSSVWIMEHNGNTMFVICKFYDEDWNEIYPLAQYPLDKYTYRIEWNFPASGWGVLKNSEFTYEIPDNNTTQEVTHSFSASEWPVVYQLQDHIDLEKEEAKNIDLLRSTSTLEVELTYPKKNSWILINNIDRMYKFKNSQMWSVKHDLGVMGLQIQVYDHNFNLIVPKNILIVSKREVLIEFDRDTSGIVGLKLIGNPTWKDDTIFSIINGGYVLLGDLTGMKYLENYGKQFSLRTYTEELYGKRTIQSKRFIRTKIQDYWEDNLYYYLKFTVPEYDYPDFNINEIGIFNNKDEMCFYALGSDIYKPKEMAFECIFKISKKNLSLTRLISAPTSGENDIKYRDYEDEEGTEWIPTNIDGSEEIGNFETSYLRVSTLKNPLKEQKVSIRIVWEGEEIYEELYDIPNGTNGTHAYNRILGGEVFFIDGSLYKAVLPYKRFSESPVLKAYYMKLAKI